MQRYILNTLIITTLFLGFKAPVKAQVLQWSNPTKLKGSAIFTKVIGENEKGVFLLRYRNKFFTKSVIIEKYGHQLEYIESRNIDLKRSRLVKLRLTAKGILLLTSQFNRKLQTNSLIGQYYDYDLKPIGRPVTLYEEPVQEFGDRGSYRVKLSDDHHYLGMLSTTKSDYGQVILTWVLFDDNFNKVREKSIEIPYSINDFAIWNFVVNTEGTIASMSKHRYEVTKRITRFHHNLFIWKNDTFFDHAITDSLDIKEVALAYNRSSDEVVISGLYAKPLFYGLEGAYLYRYNLSTDEYGDQVIPFNEELITEIKVTGDNSKEVVPEGFVFISVVPRSDGGIVLVAEQKDITTESDIIMVNGIPQSTSKNIYNFNDIIVLNIDPGGTMIWSQVVHKNQTTMNDGGYFSSAVVFVSDNFIQLIYNDQIRNSGDVMQYTIYSNGKVMSRKLLKSELDFVVVIPPEAAQVSSNKIIIPTSKNRRFALLKLVYD